AAYNEAGWDSRSRALGPGWARRRASRAIPTYTLTLEIPYDHPAGNPRSLRARPGTTFRRLLERTQYPRRPSGARRQVSRPAVQPRDHHLGLPQPSPERGPQLP